MTRPLNWCLVFCGALLTSLIRGDEPKSRPEKELPLPGETFYLDDSQAFILWPKEKLRAKPQPWIWYAPTLRGLPDQAEKWMHEQFLAAGVAVAGIDVGESYGGPQGRKRYTEFYDELTQQRGFAPRPVMLGRSRGGLMILNWAAEHPQSVAGIAGIYPVFDFRTYPGLEKAAPAYGVSVKELENNSPQYNPIERVLPLAQAKVPVFLIHGDKDEPVPLEKNSAELKRRYAAAGAGEALQLVVAEGQGHNYWEGFFRCRELIDFGVKRARGGVKRN